MVTTPPLPHFDIVINGKPLSHTQDGERVRNCVTALTADQSVEVPGMFTIELAGTGTQEDWTDWLSDDMFWVGNAVEVRMGYLGALKPLMKGEITALEPAFVASSPPGLTVRGFDLSHRLQKRRRRHTFTNQKVSDIAAQIARGAGLEPKCTDTGPQRKYVIQENRTDWEFLRQLALDINYEVLVDGKTLVFRPVANHEAAFMWLQLGKELEKFYPRLSLAQQVTEVSVRGWSEREKESYVGRARAGDVVPMGGSQSGPRQFERAFGSAGVQLGPRPVRDQAEADLLAKARLNQLALSLVSGEGICAGRTDLRAGIVVRLVNLGPRFSGDYYITSAVHRCDRSGYRTEFKARRNAT
jgi:phage protein D